MLSIQRIRSKVRVRGKRQEIITLHCPRSKSLAAGGEERQEIITLPLKFFKAPHLPISPSLLPSPYTQFFL